MSEKKQQQPPKAPPQTSDNFTVWGEKRSDPDWDTFLAALLAYALREVGAAPEPRRDDRG